MEEMYYVAWYYEDDAFKCNYGWDRIRRSSLEEIKEFEEKYNMKLDCIERWFNRQRIETIYESPRSIAYRKAMEEKEEKKKRLRLLNPYIDYRSFL